VGDPATVVSAPAGEGKIQILPSVRTPSTSKRMSLILRARAVADGLGIAAILALSLSAIHGRAVLSGFAPALRHGHTITRNLLPDIVILHAIWRSLPCSTLT